jgi:hypothetical protein
LSSASVEVPEKVQTLLEEITRGEFGGMDYDIAGISLAGSSCHVIRSSMTDSIHPDNAANSECATKKL